MFCHTETNAESERETISEFFLIEFFAYIALVLAFLLMAVVMTNWLNMDALGSFTKTKANMEAVKESGIAIGCLLAVLGVVNILGIGASGTTRYVTIVREISSEIPRTIYLLGSLFMGTTLADVIATAGNKDIPPIPTNALLTTLGVIFVFSFGSGSYLKYRISQGRH